MTVLLMLATFATCAVLMATRKLPALIAVPILALAFAALGGATPAALAAVVTDGSVRLGPVFVTVIFGAILSRVTMSTGIAETIVGYAAELGGDRPALLALILCIAVAALFTSLTGLGAIIMVGGIVLPIMLTVGIPRKTAATLFLLSFALGFIFNIAQWKFYTTTFGVERAQLTSYAFVLAAIDALALLVFALVQFRAARGLATWAIATEEPPRRTKAPPLALLTPLVPLALYFALGTSPIVAFALAALFGVLTTKPRSATSLLVSSAIRGVEDVAPAVLLFVGIGMLLEATALPGVRAALAPFVAAVAPRSALAYVVVFGLLSPLALYRGPLNPFGVGIAVYTVLAGLHVLPAVTLVAAIMAVVQVQNACDPTNTQNVWVANYTGAELGEIVRAILPYQVAVATLCAVAVGLFGTQLFGAPAFAVGFASPALADTERVQAPPTASDALLAPPSAAGTLAVASDGKPLSELGAKIVQRALTGRRDVRAIALPPARARSCADAAYTAALRFETAANTLGDGAVLLDTGLYLEDCAAWPVEQWHDEQRFEAMPRAAQVQAAALGAFFRFQSWRRERPALANALLATGLAYTGTRPTYFYTLFKSDDGEMRAYVRAGGPAYLAGLRTGDIIDKLDGRYWWEYGTFQTQARAYDGLPHTFDVRRGKAHATIALGEPYRG